MNPFGPWLPDLAPFESTGATVADNVIPAERSYRPWPQYMGNNFIFDGPVIGAISVGRSSSKETVNFCGTPDKLFQLALDGVTWTNVTRSSGGNYTVADSGFWQFTAYGDLLIAVNGVDVPQAFTLGSSTNFAALAGSPPAAQYIMGVRDFVVLGNLSTGVNRLKWCGINDPTDWTPSATTMSGDQVFPEGGAIKGLAGGEYGLVFCDRAIYRMSFEGPPTIFRFDRLSKEMGLRAPRSLATHENKTFFLSYDGFYVVTAASEISAIGAGKVDEYFKNNVNRQFIDRINGAIDPENKLYVLSYPSLTSNTCDKVMLYHWPTGQWATADLDAYTVSTSSAQRILTIDELPTVGATIDDLPYTLDADLYNGAFRVRLAAFGTDGKFGFFTGPNAEATVETGDIQLTKGRKSMLRGLRPMVVGTDPLPETTIRYRDELHKPLEDATATPVTTTGFCNTRVNARYHRAQVKIPASTVWEHAIGVDDVKFSPMGVR